MRNCGALAAGTVEERSGTGGGTDEAHRWKAVEGADDGGCMCSISSIVAHRGRRRRRRRPLRVTARIQESSDGTRTYITRI